MKTNAAYRRYIRQALGDCIKTITDTKIKEDEYPDGRMREILYKLRQCKQLIVKENNGKNDWI